MRKLIITLAVAGLLVACTTADGSGESDADASLGTEPSALASGSAGAAASGPAGTASAACEEAFAPIADLEVESASDLGDLAEVEGTVESCESVADWTAGAEQALGSEVNPNAARLLLNIRCADPAHADAPVCEDLAAS